MNGLFLLISFVLYLFSPIKYNFLFCNILTTLFLFQTILFVKNKSNGNYINFYTFFFISFFFINFFYPTFIYPIDPKFFSVFSIPFNENYINKGSALALLSASSFIWGASSIQTPNSKNISSQTNTYYYSYLSVAKVTFFFFILFIITVGKEFLSGNFAGKSGLSLYILQILSSLIILTPILFYAYYKHIKITYIFYLLVLSYILLFLSIGDRGPALSLIVLIVGLYSSYVKLIPKKYLLFGAIFGIIFMHLIGIGRTTDTSVQGNIIRRGLDNFQPNSIIELTHSFVVNTRNLYVGMEYADNEGINWGTTSMLNAVLSVIPFSQTIVFKATDVQITSSAHFFTRLAFGDNPSYGLGTNLIADVYISFGLFGCILLFIFCGRTVELYRKKAFMNGNFISLIVYYTFLSYAIYYPRTGLFMPLRDIIWTILIFSLLKSFNILKVKQIINN